MNTCTLKSKKAGLDQLAGIRDKNASLSLEQYICTYQLVPCVKGFVEVKCLNKQEGKSLDGDR